MSIDDIKFELRAAFNASEAYESLSADILRSPSSSERTYEHNYAATYSWISQLILCALHRGVFKIVREKVARASYKWKVLMDQSSAPFLLLDSCKNTSPAIALLSAAKVE